jgi:hypothetical protein
MKDVKDIALWEKQQYRRVRAGARIWNRIKKVKAKKAAHGFASLIAATRAAEFQCPRVVRRSFEPSS